MARRCLMWLNGVSICIGPTPRWVAATSPGASWQRTHYLRDPLVLVAFPSAHAYASYG